MQVIARLLFMTVLVLGGCQDGETALSDDVVIDGSGDASNMDVSLDMTGDSADVAMSHDGVDDGPEVQWAADGEDDVDPMDSVTDVTPDAMDLDSLQDSLAEVIDVEMPLEVEDENIDVTSSLDIADDIPDSDDTTDDIPDSDVVVDIATELSDVGLINDSAGDVSDVQWVQDMQDDATDAAETFMETSDVSVAEILCEENQFVAQNACVACPVGTENLAGDDASGPDTACTVAKLKAGGPGAAVMDPYEESIILPECDETQPEVRIIQTDADWADINDPIYRVFCVHPGDYRALGQIELTAHGEEGSPRVIRAFNPLKPTDEPHPVNQLMEEQAIIQKLRFKIADHWVIDGLAIVNNDPDESAENNTVDLAHGASHNVLQRLLIEGGTTGVQIVRESNHNLLQRNVIRDIFILHKDAHCITMTAAAKNDLEIRGNRIVSNEIYNCTNGLQLHINDASLGTTFPGTVLANNDFYITEDRYTDCQGNFDPNGACAAGEVGLGLKGGGTSSDPADWLHITSNRIWGWRKSDPTGLGASGSWGDGVAACCYPGQYMLFEANLITDTARGMGTSHSDYGTVIDNIIAEIYSPYDDTGQVMYAAGDSVELYRNIFKDGVHTGIFIAQDNDLRCNTIIDMLKAASVNEGIGLTADYNAYFSASNPALSGPNDLVFETTEEANNAPFCYERRILTGPETHCIDGIQPTLESPHLGHCDPQLGSKPGVGIDDALLSE